MSPFCNTTSTSMAMWQPSVLETYGEEKPDYLGEISGPMRETYPDSMGDRELIESLFVGHGARTAVELDLKPFQII